MSATPDLISQLQLVVIPSRDRDGNTLLIVQPG
jgi:hypothetical protein